MIDLGVVHAEPALRKSAFRQAAGHAYHTKTTMQQLGDVAFWRIALRAGQPLAVDRVFRENSAISPGKSYIVCSTFDSKKSLNLAADWFMLGLPGHPVVMPLERVM